jgi:hypothetical protein
MITETDSFSTRSRGVHEIAYGVGKRGGNNFSAGVGNLKLVIYFLTTWNVLYLDSTYAVSMQADITFKVF